MNKLNVWERMRHLKCVLVRRKEKRRGKPLKDQRKEHLNGNKLTLFMLGGPAGRAHPHFCGVCATHVQGTSRHTPKEAINTGTSPFHPMCQCFLLKAKGISRTRAKWKGLEIEHMWAQSCGEPFSKSNNAGLTFKSPVLELKRCLRG